MTLEQLDYRMASPTNSTVNDVSPIQFKFVIKLLCLFHQNKKYLVNLSNSVLLASAWK